MKHRQFPLFMLLALASCGTTGGSSSGSMPISEYSFDASDIPDESMSVVDGSPTLRNGEVYLSFDFQNTGYGISIHLTSDKTALASALLPIRINVRGADTGIMSTYKETLYKAKYTTLEKKTFGYQLTGSVSTNSGSVFQIKDSYYLAEERGFALDRQVFVKEAHSSDVGFQSIFSLSNADGVSDVDAFDYFLPSILYKDSSDMPLSSIASNLYLDKIYVKETRMGLPMAMVRDQESGATISLSHMEPEISVNGVVGGGTPGAVDASLQYGSLGFDMNPVSVNFVYPCSEGPTTYDCGSTWAKRFHPVSVSTTQHYKLALNAEITPSFNDGMVSSYKVGYSHIHATQRTYDNQTAYDQNLEIFNEEWAESGTAAGIPFSIALNATKESSREYSIAMGFIGQQTTIGYELYRHGTLNQDAEEAARGKKILDFWTSSTVNSTYFPYVWWDFNSSSSYGATARSTFSCYLRYMIDGMEGILNAYRFSVKQGQPIGNYLPVLNNFAQHLIAKQNADGSFNRAYTASGNVDPSTDATVAGASKLNTPIAIRFLKTMYEVTQNTAYREAALKAASYSYQNITLAKGHYVGGTPDNPNVVDKEASIYAFYGYKAAYELDPTEEFKSAMEHAAISALSWIYVYDFACPGSSSVSYMNPFANGGCLGFSLIATGHGSADNFGNYIWYDLFKAYQLSNDPFYRDAAILIENASKNCTDYDGKFGWLYRGLCPEASRVGDFDFAGVGLWLAWQGAANVSPTSSFADEFGVMSLEEYIKQK